MSAELCQTVGSVTWSDVAVHVSYVTLKMLLLLLLLGTLADYRRHFDRNDGWPSASATPQPAHFYPRSFIDSDFSLILLLFLLTALFFSFAEKLSDRISKRHKKICSNKLRDHESKLKVV